LQSKKIIIGTRGSKLALWQANNCKAMLENCGYAVTINTIVTKGDAVQDLSFDKIEGKGFFTKEIEDALLKDKVDIAVHSLKDLPSVMPKGLQLAGVSERAKAADYLVINKNAVDLKEVFEIKKDAVIGTSSNRRKMLLNMFRKDFALKDIRGNVPTRLKKLEGKFDAVVLAAAGLERLNIDLSNYHIYKLSPHHFTPAPAQGVMGYQCREDDGIAKEAIAKIALTNAETTAIEREVLQKVGGGCQTPLGIYSKQNVNTYHLWISIAAQANDCPKRIHAVATNPNQLADIGMDRLQNSKVKSVFASRNIDEEGFLFKYCKAHKLALSGKSLIAFSPIAFDLPKGDWLFFSSQKAVKYFFEQKEIDKNNWKIGAIGKSTAHAIKQMNIKVDFVGSGGNITEIADQFYPMCKEDIVLFPQAKNGLQSIQKWHEEWGGAHQQIVCYSNTSVETFDKRTEDVLIFTSPLNAKTYTEKYAIEPNQKVIVIGPTTATHFLDPKLGVQNLKMSYTPDELSLADEIFS